MKRVMAGLLIALVTFTIGVAAFGVSFFMPPTSSSPSAAQHAATTAPAQEPTCSGRYESSASRGGILHAVRYPGCFVMDPQDGYDERGLVLSYGDRATAFEHDTSDAPATPGFYLSCQVRLDFERVEVIGRKVYFRTRSVRGVVYEFSGSSGEEIAPDCAPPTH